MTKKTDTNTETQKSWDKVVWALLWRNHSALKLSLFYMVEQGGEVIT